jgi:hypothetical protein
MKLPEIFKNDIDESVRNNKYTFVGDGKETDNQKDLSLLDNLPANVYLEAGKKKLKTTIIGKTNNYIVTSGRDVIYIKDITSLKKLQ